MKIFLNGQEKEIKEGLSLLSLIEELDLDVNKIALEKDLEIIERSRFDKTLINEGSRIEIIHFIGGG